MPLSQEQLSKVVGLLKDGRSEEAIARARALIAANPKEPVLHLLLGAAYSQQEKLDPAINSFKKAVALQPTYVAALNNLGIAYRKSGKFTEADGCFARACQVEPHNSDVLFNLGVLREAEGRAEEAAGIYERVIACDPKNADALNNLGLIHHQQGRASEAVAQLQQAHTLQTANLHVLRNLGMVLESSGKAEALAEVDAKILAADPEHVVKLGSFAVKEIAAGKPVVTTLRRITAIVSPRREDVATAMWAGLMDEGPEKAFSFATPKLNTVPYAQLQHFYRDPELPAQLAAHTFVHGGAPVAGAGPVILAAASGDYAETFAHDLIGSVLAKSADATVHLHIMNPGSFDAARAFAAFAPARASYSVEELGPCEKTVYATRRFVLLPRFMAQVQRPFLVVDVDSVFNRDPAAWMDGLGAVDAAVYERPDQPFISQMVNASAFAVMPTAQGRDFAAFIASYILHFERAGQDKWYLDQLAIVAAQAWFKRNVTEVRIGALPKETLDWSDNHDPDSLIWTLKGREKRKLTKNPSA